MPLNPEDPQQKTPTTLPPSIDERAAEKQQKWTPYGYDADVQRQQGGEASSGGQDE